MNAPRNMFGEEGTPDEVFVKEVKSGNLKVVELSLSRGTRPLPFFCNYLHKIQGFFDHGCRLDSTFNKTTTTFGANGSTYDIGTQQGFKFFVQSLPAVKSVYLLEKPS